MYQYLLCLLSKQIGNCFPPSITKIEEMTKFFFSSRYFGALGMLHLSVCVHQALIAWII